jgi:hypothetical protein
MSATTRRQIRKVERLGSRVTARHNEPAAVNDFRGVYNRFVAHSKHAERLSEYRLNALRHVSDLFVAYFEGRPVCGHLFIRDADLRRVGLLMSASTRFENVDPPILVGSINRWLHWYEMQLYKSEGMAVFDFGGIGRDTPEVRAIARFKFSFGGKVVQEFDYMIASRLGRAAINLFYAIRRLRFQMATAVKLAGKVQKPSLLA